MALGGNKGSKPARLKSARRRLEAAVGRLDKALAAKNPDAGAEMQALRGENEKLTGLNKLTGERLDGAIKRLKSVLKEVR